MWGSVQILMDGDIYDQFSPSQNIVPRSDVLKTLAPSLSLSLSFARITLGRLGGANQVLTPITSFSGCGGRRPEWEEGMCSHLSQSLTPSFSVVESKERALHGANSIQRMVGCLQAQNAQATSNLSGSRSRGITCEDYVDYYLTSSSTFYQVLLE